MERTRVSTDLEHRFDLRLCSLGFWVAFLSAGIGIGGGTILVSMLHSVFGIDFKKAASMSLATIIPISFVGSISHFISYSGELPLRYYVVFIPTCILGAIIGGKVFGKRQNAWLTFAFGVFLLLVSLKMLKLFDFPSLIYTQMDVTFLEHCMIIIPAGMLFGLIAVTLGVGGGLLIVPFYVIVIGFNMHQAITLSLTTMFFLTSSITFINNRGMLKNMETDSMKSLLIPALGGAIIGAVVSSHMPADALKNVFGVFLLIMACYNIISDTLISRGLIKWLGGSRSISSDNLS